MRTTIAIDDEVFKAYKKRAAERGTTFAREVEAALRADLHQRDASDIPPFRVKVFRSGGGPALVDINDNKAIWDLFDEEDRARGHW